MNSNKKISRRELIKKLIKISGIAFGASALPSHFLAQTLNGKTLQQGSNFIIEGIGQTKDYNVKLLTRKVFEAAGGMDKFVSKGSIVVIKPNISWARKPELAASTNPDVLEAVIELCLEAGAKKVRIFDNTIHDARQCFAITGAGMVAQKTGAELIFPRSSLVRDMKINGSRLDVWPVFVPLVEADTVINLPIAKHHSLSTLTLGMKNWIGGVGGNRSNLHQDIHKTIVDLAQFFKPAITLIDCIRIMTSNGPSGGNINNVALKNSLILCKDPIAADAKAASLFGHKPEEINYIMLGQKWGMGSYDLAQFEQKKVII